MTGSERALLFDCHFCKNLKGCKNPKSKAKAKQPTAETKFYTCAVYEYNPIPTGTKPKPKPAYFNPERIAVLDWALGVIA